MSDFAIRLKGITKKFGPVIANNAVDLEVKPGTIHGIIGENGAGKSTLVSILYGFYSADSGTIEVNGKPVSIKNSSDAIEHGIGMVHQHFMLVQTFTVLENVMLGAEGGMLLSGGRNATREELLRLESEYGLEVDPDAIVGELPVGLQQRVEILKALRRGAKILILDEPTGVLTPYEADRLFDILRSLRAQGVTILLITHKLREIMDVTDSVSVIRRGEMVAHRKTSETSREELASLMVGREIDLTPPPSSATPAEIRLEAKNLNWHDTRGVARLKNVSLSLRSGEILGLAGVSGNGQSKLLEVLSGIAPIQDGEIIIGERIIARQDRFDPNECRKLGVGHVPEDRHRRGLVLGFEASENAILGYHRDKKTGSGRWLKPGLIRKFAATLMERFDVRPRNPRLRSANFSGGNQQKLVIAREIERAPHVMLIGQPTRGVDIGGIAAIHEEIVALKEQGCAVLLVSVELDEIMALSDRIAVMNAGEIVGEVARADTDARQIGLMMAGIKQGIAA